MSYDLLRELAELYTKVSAVEDMRSVSTYICISSPLVCSLYCWMFPMHGQTCKRTRLRIGMSPLPMGAVVLGRSALTSAASEAVC